MATSRFVGGILGDSQKSVNRTNVSDTIVRRAYVAIGASGAATVTCPADGAGGVITCVKNATGVYDVTYPVLAAVATSVPTIRAWVVLSAAQTVAQANFIAFAPTSGTGQFKCALNAAGTAVEPANGDILAIELVASDPNS